MNSALDAAAAALPRWRVLRTEEMVPAQRLDRVIERIESQPGMFYGCDYESEPVYRRRALAFADPALRLSLSGGRMLIEPLDDTGAAMVDAWGAALPGARADAGFEFRAERAPGSAHPFIGLLRALSGCFTGERADLGFHGAWNFDYWRLGAVEPAEAVDRDVRVLLYLPLTVLKLDGGTLRQVRFAMPELGRVASRGAPRVPVGAIVAPAPASASTPAVHPEPRDDFAPGEYAQRLAKAIGHLRDGSLMSLTLSQGFRRAFKGSASAAFATLRSRYPMPEMFFVHLGSDECLIGASPDLQARVVAGELECAPVCGTSKRGADPLEDAALGAALLASSKEAAALALCSDSFADSLQAVCEPGSLALSHRQRLHFFASVIHAADYLTGRLAAHCDPWDVLLATAAPPTISGVPKQQALRVIDELEGSRRCWFGGAVGFVGVDGDMAIGSIMRLGWFHDGMVELRTGGVVVAQSTPQDEEAESQIKARTMLRVLGVEQAASSSPTAAARPQTAAGIDVQLLLTGDPFERSLADALRRCGANVRAVREASGAAPVVVAGARAGRLIPKALHALLEQGRPALLIGGAALEWLAAVGVATSALPVPMDGYVRRAATGADFWRSIEVGVYAAESVSSASLPPQIMALAAAEDGALLAFEHRRLPIVGLLFRPESVLSGKAGAGAAALTQALCRLAERTGHA